MYNTKYVCTQILIACLFSQRLTFFGKIYFLVVALLYKNMLNEILRIPKKVPEDIYIQVLHIIYKIP